MTMMARGQEEAVTRHKVTTRCIRLPEPFADLIIMSDSKAKIIVTFFPDCANAVGALYVMEKLPQGCSIHDLSPKGQIASRIRYKGLDGVMDKFGFMECSVPEQVTGPVELLVGQVHSNKCSQDWLQLAVLCKRLSPKLLDSNLCIFATFAVRVLFHSKASLDHCAGVCRLDRPGKKISR